MRIIDSQVHIWDAVPAAFAAANPEEPASFTYQSLLAAMDENSICSTRVTIAINAEFSSPSSIGAAGSLKVAPKFSRCGVVGSHVHVGEVISASVSRALRTIR